MNNKTTLFRSGATALALLLTGATANAQFTETMGTTGASTETIAVHESNNRFSVTSLTYSGTADVRNTTPSTGYAGSSGGYNVLIQSLETFQVETINAAACTDSDSLSFGIFKSTNAATGVDFLVLEYSVDNISWTSIPYTALPTGSGTSHWYKRTVALPTDAHSASLWLRFRSTLTGGSSANPQYRIDDVSMTCGSTVDCSTFTASVAVTGDNVFCAGTSEVEMTASTTMTGPVYQWYNQDGEIADAFEDSYTTEVSGTYYVVINNADGCEITSEQTYVLAYPAPKFCDTVVEGCEGDTVEFCPQVNTGDLIISEYVEGSGFNKYLEIYNGTCGTLDLGDYELRAYHNGAAVPTYVIVLSGLLTSGNVYVIADSAATAWTGTPDLLTDDLQFNGDDALVLYNVAADFPADIFGSVGNDPGSSWRDADTTSATYGWSTENKTLIRKPCVYSGIITNPALPGIDGFPTLVTEWDTLAQDNVSNLGMHTFGPSYSFSVVSGTTAIASQTSSCAQLIIGSGSSVLSLGATFCAFNDCKEPVVAVNDTCAKSLRQTSVKDASQKVNVFPNPAKDNTTITFVQEQDGMVSITLTDLSGQVVLSETVKAEAGQQRIGLDLSGLATGAYVCHISSDSVVETVRIVKSK